MRTTARKAPLALVARHPVLAGAAPARVPPVVESGVLVRLPIPGSMAVRAHARAVLRACLNELPERYRMAVWLSDVEQRSVQDVAALLGITIAMATARLERARQMLSKALCRLCVQAGPSVVV
jgi:DNA-directed RNA polymerase specialized sigma24 family protein